MDVMSAIDLIDAHMLPFFSTQASTGMSNQLWQSEVFQSGNPTASQSWPIVQQDLDWFHANGQNKKLYLSQVRSTVGRKELNLINQPEWLAFGDVPWGGTQQPVCSRRCPKRKGKEPRSNNLKSMI